MSALPTIERDQPGRDDRIGMLVRLPWHTHNDDIRDQMKAHIQPKRDRYWWPEVEAWWFAAEHETALVQLLLGWWPSVSVISDDEDLLLSRDGIAASQGRLL